MFVGYGGSSHLTYRRMTSPHTLSASTNVPLYSVIDMVQSNGLISSDVGYPTENHSTFIAPNHLHNTSCVTICNTISPFQACCTRVLWQRSNVWLYAAHAVIFDGLWRLDPQCSELLATVDHPVDRTVIQDWGRIVSKPQTFWSMFELSIWYTFRTDGVV